MNLQSTLYGIEHELAEGDGDTYRRYLTHDAVPCRSGRTCRRR